VVVVLSSSFPTPPQAAVHGSSTPQTDPSFPPSSGQARIGNWSITNPPAWLRMAAVRKTGDDWRRPDAANIWWRGSLLASKRKCVSQLRIGPAEPCLLHITSSQQRNALGNTRIASSLQVHGGALSGVWF
jgi:hypothetical protein